MSDSFDPSQRPHPQVHAATSPSPHVSEADDAPTAEDHAPIDAFTTFYKQSVPRLVAFLRWQGASVPDAADCVQEAMIQAYRRWSTIDQRHAWCRQVASRLYARRLASLEEPIADTETAGSPLLTANTDLDSFEQRHHVLPALEQLPLRQRQIMAWTYDGCTPTEIAKELKMTPEAVRSSLKKARMALKKLLNETGEKQ
jgi:RNA polymerase sigma factor (sigma-70 family)